jgi:hypothetical protein
MARWKARFFDAAIRTEVHEQAVVRVRPGFSMLTGKARKPARYMDVAAAGFSVSS